MESIKPQDRPKVIVLLVGVVLVFAFLFYRILGSSGGGSAPTPTAPVAQPVASAPAAQTVPNDVIDVPTLFASSTLNPFQTVLPDKQALAAAAAARVASAPRPRGGGVLRPMIDVPPMPAAMEGGRIEPMSPQQNPDLQVKREEPRLKGIVYGSKPIAVISLEQDEYVVGVGQANPSGFVVVKIGDNSVDLRKGNETFHLTMGAT